MEDLRQVRQRVADNSRAYRKAKGHTQEQAFEECGLNFSRMENINHDPRLKSLITLANYGHRTITEVMNGG
jgi:hypothetical protein